AIAGYTPFGGDFKRLTIKFPVILSWLRARVSGLHVWIAVLVCGAASMCVALIESGYGLGSPLAVAVLAVLALGAERESIRLTPDIEVSVASILCVFAAVVFGPLAGIVVGATGLLADLPRRDVAQPLLRWLNWTGVRVFAAGSA